MSRVLAAIDLGEGSSEALRQACAWAERSKGKLAIVHVMPDLVGTHTLLPHETEGAALGAADLERRVRDLVAKRALDITGRTDAEIFVDVGGDHERIVQRARAWKADLVVVGSHGHAGLERIFGDVADKVVRNAPCPVLVVRRSPENGCVMAATDLSDGSLVAVDAAAQEARRSAAPLVLVHVVHAPSNAYVAALGAALGAPPSSCRPRRWPNSAGHSSKRWPRCSRRRASSARR